MPVHKTTSEPANNISTARAGCRYCDKNYSSKESRNRHERDKHSLEIAGIHGFIQPNTGIKYFKCPTPGCGYMHRRLRTVRDHRERCPEDESEDPLEENPTQAKEIVQRDLALGRRLFPFLYDQPAGPLQTYSLSLIDWDASLDNPIAPDWWKTYLAMVQAPEHLGSAIKYEQPSFDSLMDTSGEGTEDRPLSPSVSVPLDADIKGEDLSANNRVDVASSLSKESSLSSTSFDLEQSQPT
ncbi:hypothetical protein EDD18DRAFT_171545 [Armillaria luteobubalina]|uniref:C2H2-type domain-containing protein n=1 Tax=Armillaria luteobubalina TaxID=153913 RepID=A0AA39UNJ2_9AGAR|nr:hypothetical protein EDD18DRAFT_171545 [Armillaria luteobubalina]